MSDGQSTTNIDYRTIRECPGFRFGSDGSAWKFDRGVWVLIRGTSRVGGIQIRICIDGQWKLARRHLMVAWAFHGPCPHGLVCRRLDNNPENDRSDNLAWGDRGDDVSGRTEKPCAACGTVKPIEDFARRHVTRDGRDEQCKICKNAKVRAYHARPEVKARVKRLEVPAKLKHRYGITANEYKALQTAQGGVCAICERMSTGGPKTKRLIVDHDHDTGRVRGLLCNRCNWALGVFGDSIAGLTKVIDYLRRSEAL